MYVDRESSAGETTSQERRGTTQPDHRVLGNVVQCDGAENDVPQFIGTYRAGSGGHALWVSKWDSFEAKWKELSKQGLRLVSIAVYQVKGTAMYAGAFLPGTDGYALWVSGWDSFESKWKELSKNGLRLISVS